MVIDIELKNVSDVITSLVAYELSLLDLCICVGIKWLFDTP